MILGMNKEKKSLAILSDIHGNRWALESVLEDIRRRGVQQIVNLGDSLYGPLDPRGTADILVGMDIPTISGNEDRELHEPRDEKDFSATLLFTRRQLQPQHLSWLKSLPMTHSIDNTFFMFHSSPLSDHEYLMVEVKDCGVYLRKNDEIASALSQYDETVFLCGHDHIPRTIYLPDGKLMVNPGSVGLPAYTDDLPFPHIMEAGTPHARYSIMRQHREHWSIENIALPYDWHAAAAEAEKNGRPDWALWLRSGRANI